MARPDYKIQNYCAQCDKTYPKDVLFCSNCKQYLRRYSRSTGRKGFKIKCAECGHYYGDCACMCCRVDELQTNELDKTDMDNCSGEFCQSELINSD